MLDANQARDEDKGGNKVATSAAIENIHSCDPPAALNSALIAFPGSKESEIDVCCAVCGLGLGVLPPPSAGAETKLGLCMAVCLFVKKEAKVSVAVGYEDGSIVLWDVHRLSTLAHGKLHSEPIMALTMDRDGLSGVSGSAENNIVIFNINYDTNTVEKAMKVAMGKKQGVADIDLSAGLVAVAGWDGKIRVFRRKNGKPLAILRYHQKDASAVVFGSKTRLLASGARDGTIAVWDVYSEDSLGRG